MAVPAKNRIPYIDDEAKFEALSVIVNRRLQSLDVPDMIGAYDMGLIRKHLEHQKDQLGG